MLKLIFNIVLFCLFQEFWVCHLFLGQLEYPSTQVVPEVSDKQRVFVSIFSVNTLFDVLALYSHIISVWTKNPQYCDKRTKQTDLRDKVFVKCLF